MAGGGFAAPAGGRAHDYGDGVTSSVVVTCLMAASCGLIFGYDIGVSVGNDRTSFLASGDQPNSSYQLCRVSPP
ncbi:hypothetical protein EJB05_37832 [Eragrostis curvula]|uniref:Major facilitator superfamily (MFS) profile domain-containing protein n=1 Tax=Eragrostis curvula TaxID=38414 RepID=A0A5J9TSR7_9POAL|nr:hypothetical protein EJB05_37832 [Eragrostis curvula]